MPSRVDLATSAAHAPATTVVGIDGGDGGFEALALAARLSRGRPIELILVSAYPHGSGRRSRLVWPRVGALADAERVLDEARSRLPSSVVTTECVAAAGATPGSVLQQVAAERDASLIVVGSSRRAAPGRVLGGDVVVQTLVHPPCPVAVAPRGLLDPAGAVAHIGVGVDGTPESLAAVRWAGALADESLAMRTLDLIHVDATSSLAAPAEGGAIDHLAERHRFETFAALKLVANAGSPVRVTWTDAAGPVIPVLADLSSGLDVLVVGTHGRGLFGRLLHGGVAQDIAGRASCPVVAVPCAGGPPGKSSHA